MYFRWCCKWCFLLLNLCVRCVVLSLYHFSIYIIYDIIYIEKKSSNTIFKLISRDWNCLVVVISNNFELFWMKFKMLFLILNKILINLFAVDFAIVSVHCTVEQLKKFYLKLLKVWLIWSGSLKFLTIQQSLKYTSSLNTHIYSLLHPSPSINESNYLNSFLFHPLTNLPSNVLSI